MATCYGGSRRSFSSITFPASTNTHLKVDSNPTAAQNGGLIVIGETVATLHRESQGSKVNKLLKLFIYLFIFNLCYFIVAVGYSWVWYSLSEFE